MQDVHLPGIVKNMIIPCYQNHILREDQKENIKKKKGGGIGGGAMAVCSQLFLLNLSYKSIEYAGVHECSHARNNQEALI